MLSVVRHIFQEGTGFWPRKTVLEQASSDKTSGDQLPANTPSKSSAIRLKRTALVEELRFYTGELNHLALPSEQALGKLLLPSGVECGVDGAFHTSEDQHSLSFRGLWLR